MSKILALLNIDDINIEDIKTQNGNENNENNDDKMSGTNDFAAVTRMNPSEIGAWLSKFEFDEETIEALRDVHCDGWMFVSLTNEYIDDLFPLPSKKQEENASTLRRRLKLKLRRQAVLCTKTVVQTGKRLYSSTIINSH
jgi:hypothetical protein